jgi:ferredoxin
MIEACPAYGLTRTMQDVLRVIQELTALDGVSPSYDELARECSLTSRGRVAALLLHVSTAAQAINCELAPTPERVAADRRWERAEQIAWGLLTDTIPVDADLFPDGPDFAALGIRACRVCGCTDDHACPVGCFWIEDDLCSECIPDEAA